MLTYGKSCAILKKNIVLEIVMPQVKSINLINLLSTDLLILCGKSNSAVCRA